ncbi:N-acetylmuramoyl-L-alanine amidase [Clostridium cochlearium]|uniref:N-acetylmuramoyl-L-alanine amidase n=1 Tax=Clostridium cochlearium TaxID=1494 RepID=UPI0031401907
MKINESNLKFKKLVYINKPNKIIYHHTEATKATIEDIHRWHLEQGWSGCGYHFLVRKDGSIWRGRPENAVGAHSLRSNLNSIGICAEGNFMKETMGQVQKKSLIELGIYLKNKYDIVNIYGHKDVYSTDCPGINYPLEEIKLSIKKGEQLRNQSFIKIEAKAYTGYKGEAVVELIMKDYSSDVVRAFGWVDTDEKASWAFDIVPPNFKYGKLEKNASKIIKIRNEGQYFSKGNSYKIKVKGYNNKGKIVAEDEAILKIPII